MHVHIFPLLDIKVVILSKCWVLSVEFTREFGALDVNRYIISVEGIRSPME